MASPQETYEISAVARITGISPHVLRVWERRYSVVEPERTDSKRRRYSREDIKRLSMIKTLVDQGNAISTVANLSIDQLESRLADLGEAFDADSSECKIVVAGTLVGEAVKEATKEQPALTVVGEFADFEVAVNSIQRDAIDILVVEQPTLFPESITNIQDAVKKLGARRAIIVYQFAGSEALEPLDLNSVTALRAPVTASEFQLAFLSDAAIAAANDRKIEEIGQKMTPLPAVDGVDIPDRTYSDGMLAKLTKLSSVVQCECPQHLASLISSLGAFERYSGECESRNVEDAELHGFLHRATAQCRSEMETALTEVLKHEGIDVNSI